MDVRVGPSRRLSVKELMLLNCGVGEDSWEFLGLQGDQNQSILKEISPEYSLKGLMLKLKLQYFSHLLWKADSLDKTLMLGKIEGSERRWWQKTRWLNGITDSMDTSLSKLQELVKFSSVALPCPTLCDPMNCSTPGLPVHHQLPESTQTHVHWVSDAI